jgi:hypothetical protein
MNMDDRHMLTEAARRALETLDSLGIEYSYDIRNQSYTFEYFGVKIRLETTQGEWGVCLSAEFHFWQTTSYDLMKSLDIVNRGNERFIVKEIANGLGMVAKEWLIDSEDELPRDSLIGMIEELHKVWHSISFNLYVTGERDEVECLYLGE